MPNTAKTRKILITLAALGLAAALTAALAWYRDAYVNWNPELFPSPSSRSPWASSR